MLNILIPIAGKSPFFPNEEYVFPKPLIDIKGRPMIERVVNNLQAMSTKRELKFTFVVPVAECKQYHMDNILKLVSKHDTEVVKLSRKTKGALCSCLMAIEHISDDDPLLIANADQVFDLNLNEAIVDFENRNLDAGLVVFDSVHPRWSFARTNSEGIVVETAEKNPISRHAIAGLYYFKSGRSFIDAAMRSIEFGTSLNGSYYLSPAINQLILRGRQVGLYTVENERFHSFFSPSKIEEFERKKISNSLMSLIS